MSASQRKHLAETCPCGTGRAYLDCCGRFHQGALYLMAPDPESLMRSRYAAFVLDLRAYLMATWHPDFRPSEIEAPEAGLKWLGLEVKKSAVLPDGRGMVEFVARSKWGGRAHRMHEISEFVQQEGRWLYTQAMADA